MSRNWWYGRDGSSLFIKLQDSNLVLVGITLNHCHTTTRECWVLLSLSLSLCSFKAVPRKCSHFERVSLGKSIWPNKPRSIGAGVRLHHLNRSEVRRGKLLTLRYKNRVTYTNLGKPDVDLKNLNPHLLLPVWHYRSAPGWDLLMSHLHVLGQHS